MQGESEKDRYRKGLALVMETFHTEVGPAKVAAYWLALKDRLSIDEFEDACARLMVDAREFPPRPRDFLDAVAPDVAVAAHQWWERLTDFSRSGPWEYDPSAGGSYSLRRPIPDRARFALERVGGARRLASADTRDMDFIRQRFEAAYKTATDHEIQRPDHPLLPRRSGGVQRLGDAIPAALPDGSD